LSPLVQVMQTPISVGSHLHMPITRLQLHAVMPLNIAQQLHIPPAIMVQRFWSMLAVTLSSQTQVIFIPPGHFSKVMVQRGTITMFMPVGVVVAGLIMPGVLVMPMPVMPIPARSFVNVVAIRGTPWTSSVFLVIRGGRTAGPARLRPHSCQFAPRTQVASKGEKLASG
jgi:hypothetical protein